MLAPEPTISPRSVVPLGGAMVAFVAIPKNATSIESSAVMSTDGLVMLVELPLTELP